MLYNIHRELVAKGPQIWKRQQLSEGPRVDKLSSVDEVSKMLQHV